MADGNGSSARLSSSKSNHGPRTADHEQLLTRARAAFTSRFGGEPSVAGCAPGRVELLGNHTDYNGGLVMSAAIDRHTVAVGRRSTSRDATVDSVNFQQSDTFSLDDIERTEAGTWTRYVRGVCWALNAWHGPLTSGFEASVAGDVPLGAGLSSSASLQTSLATFLIQLGLLPGRSSHDFSSHENDLLRMELAKELRRSENEFVGVGSGLLDQFSSLFGRADHALFLDCDTLIHDTLPLGNPAPAIVVCDSKTSRQLADGMYDRRRAECDRVAAFFRDKIPHHGAFQLSWLTLEQLENEWEHLDPIGRKRARHVLSENERVRLGVEALKRGDVVAFGRLMSASHASSRDDFENSSRALDSLIEAAEAAPGFVGGKLSGAGWAGCTVNLVCGDLAHDFAESVCASYSRTTGADPEIHICRAADGAFGLELVSSNS
jgi:galactokinase